MFRVQGKEPGGPGAYDVEEERRQANMDLATKVTMFAAVIGIIRATPWILRNTGFFDA